MAQSSRPRVWTLALVGSILMFAGWMLAIVPAFHHLHRVALVVVVAVIGFGLVLIPAGIDVLTRQPEGGKRGPRTIIVSMLPSAVIFFITVAVLQIDVVFRVLAIVCEISGMAIYGWSSRVYQRGTSGMAPERKSRGV